MAHRYRTQSSHRPQCILDGRHQTAIGVVSVIMRNPASALSLTCLAVLAFCSQTFAQTQDDLFNGDILHEIRLYIAPEDYVTFKQTNFTCQTQDFEALA